MLHYHAQKAFLTSLVHSLQNLEDHAPNRWADSSESCVESWSQSESHLVLPHEQIHNGRDAEINNIITKQDFAHKQLKIAYYRIILCDKLSLCMLCILLVLQPPLIVRKMCKISYQ